MIDLHCHSTASDGTYSPTEIIDMANEIGLSAIALTDHDTVAGLDEFIECAREQKCEAVPGIELAARQQSSKQTFHILGLFIRHQQPELLALTEQILRWRNERNQNIITRLSELGFKITFEEVKQNCPGEVVGRPHIAKTLVQKKYFRSIRRVFEKLIGRGCEAYIPRQVPSPEECIKVIHDAGGLAIWAHPYSSDSMTNKRCRELATELSKVGLDGIEAYYSLHRQAQTKEALKIAKELQILVAGGSDFHGTHFPKLSLGKGYGNLQVPDDLMIPLREKIQLENTKNTSRYF